MYDVLVALALTASSAVAPPVSAGIRAPAPRDISGTVSDSSGTPIADARVALIELRRTTSTSPEGRFSFPEVSDGVYHLSVSAIGFAPVVQRVTVSDSARALHVVLTPSVVELQALQVTASPPPPLCSSRRSR